MYYRRGYSFSAVISSLGGPKESGRGKIRGGSVNGSLGFREKHRSPTLVVNGPHVMGTRPCTVHTCLLYGPADDHDGGYTHGLRACGTRALCTQSSWFRRGLRLREVVRYVHGERGPREDLNRVAESRTTGGRRRRRDTTRKRTCRARAYLNKRSMAL